MTERLRFWKAHGLGNDFVVLTTPVEPDEARALCHRRHGVGADGVLIVTPAEGGGEADASVVVINADGSLAEICGNGLRCVALHVIESDRVGAKELTFQTGAGLRRCTVVDHPRTGSAVVEVEMGHPSLARADVPAMGDGQMLNEPVDLDGRRLEVTAVGMGNPHAVMFGSFTEADVTTLGPRLERHPLFPAGVNAGFARVARPDRIELTVWERGAGLTGACGSGACAAAVAACVTDRAKPGGPIIVAQPGGELTITVGDQGGQVLMRGPAQIVFEGLIELSNLR